MSFPAREILDRVKFVSRFYFEGEEIAPEPPVHDEIGKFIARVERSDAAFQRPIKKQKVRDLVHFYESVAEQPAIPGTVLLITRETLRFTSTEGSFGRLSDPSEKFDIIDGQHRLAGLHFFSRHLESQGRGGLLDSIEVPALVFDGKSADFAAEMFVTINATQTRINRSHLVDLLEKVSLASPEERFASKLVKMLYSEGSSPLRYRVNMLGGRSKGEKWILQSELYNEIYRLTGGKEKKDLKIRQALLRRFDLRADRAYPLIADYFKAIREAFGDAWGDREFQVTSAVALKAYIRALPAVLLNKNTLDRWERERSAAVLLERVRAWGGIREDLRTEGFFNRYPAKGQLERVRLVQRDLEKLLE